jgi:hypothetical protein
MDLIKQYLILSDIKPRYQKLTEPLYSVNKARFYLNQEEVSLIYKGMGMYVEDSKKEGGNDDDRTSQVIMLSLVDDWVDDMDDVI